MYPRDFPGHYYLDITRLYYYIYRFFNLINYDFVGFLKMSFQCPRLLLAEFWSDIFVAQGHGDNLKGFHDVILFNLEKVEFGDA